MKTFTEYLAIMEGMINVPRVYVDDIVTVVYSQLFSYIETALGHEEEQYGEIFKRIKAFRHAYGITATQIFHGNKDFEWEVDIDYSKIHYTPPPKAIFPPLLVNVRWATSNKMPANADATYDFRRNCINLNTEKFAEFIENPSVGFLMFLLGNIRSDIEHELSHMIQYLYFERPSQGKATRDNGYFYYKTKNNKRLDTDDKEFKRLYYTSPLEFLPNLKSAVDEFDQRYNIDKLNLDELKDAVRAITGFKSHSNIDIYEIFASLLDDAKKTGDYSLYNKATKEFYKEVMIRKEKYERMHAT